LNQGLERVMLKGLTIAITALVCSICISQAQEWPTRTIRLVVPFSAGGSADTLGRVFARTLSETLGQQVYVENRAGAGGVVASAQVARGEPDGYTLLVSGVASHAIAPALNSHTGYDPVRDFTHIAYMGGPPLVWVVHPSLGVRSFDELIALVRRGGEPLGYGSPGAGTQGHLVAAYLAQRLGLKMQHVPYKGAGPAMFDVVAGHIKMTSTTWTTALSHIRSGALVPIAITADRRMPDFPNVPTFKELGYPELVATTWFSISGPPGMPKAIVDRINEASVKALDDPEVVKILKQEGIAGERMDAGTFTKFVEKEVVRWAPIVTISGAKAE
jgi:tripartite-type tricarboxylate transporter receptor subunit TctC